MKFTTALIVSSIWLLGGCSGLRKDSSQEQISEKAYEIETKEISYNVGKTKMVGYLAVPKSEGKRPGVLVVHEWWGQTEYPRTRAEMLARQGYVALAVDMYGERKVATHPKDAQAFAQKTMKDFKTTEARFNKALETLQSQESVDPEKIAALGYCYGGGLILELARRGAPLDMVFSYHGMLQGMSKATPEKTKAQVFVFNGGADPMVPKEHVQGFEKEMKAASVDYEFHNYPEAVHAFTNARATENGKKFNLPLAYDEEADKDSWNKTLKALAEL